MNKEWNLRCRGTLEIETLEWVRSLVLLRWLYCVILSLFIIVGRVGDWGDGLLICVTRGSEFRF